MRTRLIYGIAVAAIGLAVWRFLPQSSDTIAPRSIRASDVDAPPGRETGSPPIQPNVLNERTLIGTKWEREGFAIEFSADGKLLIGGRERARWRIEGSRIRLYREATGEEHWLEIVGDKLMWNGQDIARVQ